MGWFTGTRDTKKPAREAIIRLRQNLQLLERKEDHLQKQIDEQQSVARANAVGKPEGMLWVIVHLFQV
jgi:charged multivesicular body protein 4